MPCLSPALRTKYQNDLTRVQTQIATLNTTIESALEHAEVEEYKFNSGEGSQQTKRTDVKKLMDTLETLESRERWLINKLEGRSLVNMNLRRRRYTDGRYNGRI